ncbi:MAG TPA: 5-formyltetrahydrofolate cyclo-ligase [Pyrinomonadaceae bacterium]|nr:5-formyltetrahydrofolate cyclo-ligase [Pyrinomonadaceae bacterium]
MTKDELRKELLKRRRTLSSGEIVAISQQVAERFFAEIDLAAVGCLHTFIRIAKFNEIDTSMIYMRIWRDRPRIATFAPRIDHETGRMESVRFDEHTPLVDGRWGIREPAEGESVSPDKLDLILVPMLGFDHLGHRIGYGKGFYDRFLRQTRVDCLKVGLCHWAPLEEAIETHEGDVPVGLVITPDAVFRPETSVKELNDWSN